MTGSCQRLSAALIVSVIVAGGPGLAQHWPFHVADLRDRDVLTILVFGDAGTGDTTQHGVGRAMFDTCERVGCDLALMLGDNIYDNGIEVDRRRDGAASFREILSQFERKFASPYAAFQALTDFHFWAVLGNHDYRRNSTDAMVTYSEFSDLWRLPALHYELPLLPEWVQIHAVHTDTDVRRDLNGLQVASLRRALCREGYPDRWKIAFGHHPVYNSGHHRNDANEQRTRALLEQPLLLECGVHFYLSGHAHHQEHLTAEGFEQVIQGAAAKSKGRSRARRETHVRQRFFSKTFGFAILRLDAEQARLDFFDVPNPKAIDVATEGAPTDVVRTYSWCGTRPDVGHPTQATTPCPGSP